MAIEIGDRLPPLTLKNHDGEDVNLVEFVENKAVVIYFYPKNFTPGCTKEACGFRDSYEDFKKLGAEVIGISSDSSASHAKFRSRYNLPFIFLSDEDKKARKLFGVKGNFLGLLPGRETFVFNKKGVLIYKFNSIKGSRHISKALGALKKFQEKA